MTPSQPKECGFASHPETSPVRDRSEGDELGSGTALRGASGWWAIIPALCVLGLALVHGPQAGSLDDAFVVLADARQLMPEGPRVSGDRLIEGSTSLLDCAVKALWLRIVPGTDPLAGAGLLGLIWLITLAVVTVRVVGRWSSSWGAAAVAGCLVALSPGLTESAGYLLEGPLFALLWTLTLVAAVEARPGRVLLWAFLLAAARPEGLALAPVVLFWAGRGSRAGSVRWGLAGLGATALVTGIRLAIYGAWVPNTFHAKSSDSRLQELADGWHYLVDVLVTSGRPSLVAAALLAGVFGVALLARSALGKRGSGGLLGFALLYAVGLVVSGGDSYTGARLFMPVALPVWLALGRAVPRAHSQRALPLLLAPLILLGLASLGPSLAREASHPWRLVPQAVHGLASGPVGLEAFAGDEEVFEAVAGALGSDETFAHLHTQRFRWFEPDAKVLDLTGLTDRRIARLPAPGPIRFGRASIELALEERVGALHLDPLRGRVVSLVDAPDLARALSDSAIAGRYLGEPFLRVDLADRLADQYVAASRRFPAGGGYFNLLVRADLAGRFLDQGFRVSQH
ncbi:MAG: hypothetical protein ACJAQ3_001228 [Planctomycetota bacterium]|jgi:hypothetical protein